MAPFVCGYERTRKRKRKKKQDQRKLLTGEQVEVLYSDEGLNGSWHTGKVIDIGEYTRLVEYTDLLTDDNCTNLKESVGVSAAVEGLLRKTPQNYRGNIRPSPPPYEIHNSELKYGLCVDAFVNDAWWEGVIFDRLVGSNERLVFFPDQGDQQMVDLDCLRLTQEWNEVSGHWNPRGEWVLLQVLQSFEEEQELPVSTREIWFDLRTADTFLKKIGVWTFGSESIWHILVSELIQELRDVISGMTISPQYIDIPLERFSSLDCTSTDKYMQGENMSTEGLKGRTPRKRLLPHRFRDINEVNGKKGILTQKLNNGVCGSKNTTVKASGTHGQTEYQEATKENRLILLSDHSADGDIYKPLDLQAAYYPEAVKFCAFKGRRHQLEEITKVDGNVRCVKMKAKQHLLYLGWKIYSRTDFRNRERVSFVSPKGKYYYSIRKACRTLFKDNHEENQQGKLDDQASLNELASANCLSPYLQEEFLLKRRRQEYLGLDAGLFTAIDKFQPSRVVDSGIDMGIDTTRATSNKEDLFSNDPGLELSVYADAEPGNYPEAVLEYKNYWESFKVQGKQKLDANLIRLNAEKHLRFMGWRFSGQSGKDLIITSPTGKPFRSFYAACDDYMREKNSKNSEFKELGVDTMVIERHTKSKRKVIPHVSHIKSAGRQNYRLGGHISSKGAGPSKRPHQIAVQTPGQRSKTVLSLLIDNDIILPRQKVHYIRKKDSHVLKSGNITREGIKCTCCRKVYTLSNFEVHAGSTYRRPAASIFLSDGRSLLQCQMEMVDSPKPKHFQRLRLKGDYSAYNSDTICSICRDGGSLLLCDHCPSAFHISCVGLQKLPMGNWFCPSCLCGICGRSEFNSNTEQFTEKSVLYCDQCEREYHVGCMRDRGNKMLNSCPVGNWFCSKSCSKIFLRLRQLLGKSKSVGVEGLSWTLLRSSTENSVDCLQLDAGTMAEHDTKLFVALSILHECFVPIKEPRTRSDVAADILFNKESELRRLNFYGFYTMILERGDELISVATFRVFGEKVAEMPLIGTRLKYRRQGMCRLLVNELEKLLLELGVKTLLLPAVPQLLETWTSSFGFTKMSRSETLNISEYSVLNFLDTSMCQKFLTKAPNGNKKAPKGNCKELIDTSTRFIENEDSERFSNVSEVIEMVEPIMALPCFGFEACTFPVGASQYEQSEYQSDAELSPSLTDCVDSIGGKEPKAGADGRLSFNVAPYKCTGSNASEETNPSIKLKPPTTGPNVRFSGICYRRAGKNNSKLLVSDNNQAPSTFKHVYKRRKTTEKQRPA